MMDLITSCTSLSLIVGIPNGLVLPGLPGFGIITCFIPCQLNFRRNTASRSSKIRSLVMDSIVTESSPGVWDPLFFFSLL